MNLHLLRLRYVGALLILLAFIAVVISHAKEAKPAKTEDSVTLPTFQVKGTPVCSFGIGVVGTRDPQTRKISRLFIADVAEGSTAADYGLKEGDEILTINGQKVDGMDGEVKAGRQLFELLINQPPGQRIELEVAVRQVKKMTLKAMTSWSP